MDLAERTILEVAHEDRRKDFRRIEIVLDAETTKLAELSRQGKAITGTASGFEDLDVITGGFQPGNLIILAARPSMGKSALMANFCENAALEGKKAVALFSLEMSESELAQRFIASQALDQGRRPAQGQRAELALAEDHAGERAARPGRRCTSTTRRDLSVLDVRAKARRLRAAERRRARA